MSVHFLQLPCPATEINPAEHSVQLVDPPVENVPAEHDVQLVAPPVENVPGPHGVQLVDPAAAYVPPAHDVHDRLATPVEYDPPGHVRQWPIYTAPAYGCCVPAGQAILSVPPGQ